MQLNKELLRQSKAYTNRQKDLIKKAFDNPLRRKILDSIENGCKTEQEIRKEIRKDPDIIAMNLKILLRSTLVHCYDRNLILNENLIRKIS